MKFSQRYPQIMNFYEKRQNNDYFLTSNTIDFGEKSSKSLPVNNRLHLAKVKHIIEQKLEGPLKDLGRISVCNLSLTNPNMYISNFLIPNCFFLFFSFRKTLRTSVGVGRTFKSGKDMTY